MHSVGITVAVAINNERSSYIFEVVSKLFQRTTKAEHLFSDLHFKVNRGFTLQHDH